MKAATNARTWLATTSLIAATLLTSPLRATPEGTGARVPRQLLAAVHVHSTASSGSRSLPELARLARQSGLDVVVLAENLGYEFRYAPAGLRLFAEARTATPTLERHGIARFLREVDEARAAEPGILLLPGAEVPPYYYWTGSPLRGDLTLHDMQRNVLLVPPPSTVEAPGRSAEFFKGIPAVGNRYYRRYGVRSLALLLPGLLCVALAARMLARAGSRGFRRRRGWMAAALLVTGGLLLSTNFPFSAPSLDPYYPGASHQAAENLFAYVQRNGGLSFWSMPEAVDYHERGVGPLTVRLSTDPYTDVLSKARGYTGFGGVYAETVTAWEAGDAWDDTLAAFQSGRRATAPWIIGESAFHYSGQADKELADVVTVLLVEERTEDGVFSALAGGRSYALRRSDGAPDLRLAEFSLTSVDAGVPSVPSRTARSGQTLTVAAVGSLEAELVLRVQDVAATRTPLQVDIVRNGKLHRRIEATTPFEGSWREPIDPSEDSIYYRVIVRATRAAYLVSNPVFLQRRP